MMRYRPSMLRRFNLWSAYAICVHGDSKESLGVKLSLIKNIGKSHAIL
jgi:hypothetical protein